MYSRTRIVALIQTSIGAAVTENKNNKPTTNQNPEFKVKSVFQWPISHRIEEENTAYVTNLS